ncbi:hypothetical protein BUALT_Bualt02G0231500 [Buddleja alternifolia]|uniref:glutathione transferase n=1 Tax=Buddleja alternifolia TaxID=168488 RepID=A0AAV6Y4S2_9LAMI|nr:hypothetical protein BUALT_Bualt02G0231500 [Buddleja alternifolia]
MRIVGSEKFFVVMGFKVYGHPLSAPTQRVLLTLTEKELEYEFVFVDLLAGENKEEPFISLNPFGQVPVFEDGDLKLIESRAITKYISYLYADKGTPLFDKDPKKKAIIGVWLEIEALRFDAAAHRLNFEIVVKPIKGMTADEAVVEQLGAQLATVLDVYEARLGESKYLGGDDYSLVDLHHIPFINKLMQTKIKTLFDERPCVSVWCKDLLTRPIWHKVLAGLNM